MTHLRHLARHLVLPPLAALALAVPAAGADLPGEIEVLTRQWIGLERQRDALRADWQRQRPVLEQQLALLAQEEEELRTLLASAEDRQSEVEARRLELLEAQAAMEQEQAAVERELDRAVIGIRRLHGQLPPPLAEAWREDIGRLDDDNLGSSEVMQIVVDMLTALQDFQQRLSLHEDMITLEDGTSYRVRQVYLGLSHGWYLSVGGELAGAGAPSPEGWRWQTLEDGAFIADMIAILESRQPARLLRVPLSLPADEGSR